MLKEYWTKFVRVNFRLIIIGLVAFLFATVSGLAAPLIIKELIDDAMKMKNTNSLNIIILVIIVLYVLRGFFSYLSNYAFAKAGNTLLAKQRLEMYSKLQKTDYSFFVNTNIGDIISLFTNDLELVFYAVSQGLPEILIESLNLIVIISILLYLNWNLAIVTFITIPFIIIAIVYFNKKIANISIVVENTMAKILGLLHQCLISIRIIQSYVRENYEYIQFTKSVNKASVDLLRTHRLNAVLIPLIEFLAAIGLIIITWYGGMQVIVGNLTIGGMFTFLIYIINIPAPVRKISNSYTKLKLGTMAWYRIDTFKIDMNFILEGNIELICPKGVIEFKNVSFSYSPEKKILKNISIISKPGEVLAIVGPSGAGKSSLANLLLRLFDPTEGVIKIDTVDIKKYTINSLRKHIGFIQQEPILFNTSIIENIRYGKNTATIEEIIQAAIQADIHEFIKNLPFGYNSNVGELGGLLSGGQRQRIAIARAIVKKPTILLFDEPTVGLDFQSEKQVISAIRKIGLNKTIILITHRLSIINKSDKVVYLADGKIIESGTHLELILRNGSYTKAVKMGQLV